MDDYYIAEGTHLRLFDKLGAHLIEHEGADGRPFRRLGAQRPARLGGRRLQRLGRPPPSDARCAATPASGRSSFPDIGAGHALQISRSSAPDGSRLPLKADPFAFKSELRPDDRLGRPRRRRRIDWGDEAHRSFWRKADPRRKPMSIYEVHAGSWQRRARRHASCPGTSSPTS